MPRPEGPDIGSTIDEDYKRCVQASSDAIEIDPQSSKALYRRARALSEPMTARDEDTDRAIDDLAMAAKVAPDDRAVRTLLTKLRQGRSSAKRSQADAYSGLFGKAELYDEKTMHAQKERDDAEKRIAEQSSDRPRTAEDCEREQKEAEAAIEHLKRQGRLQDAASLELKLQHHRKQLDEYKAAAAEAEADARRRDPRCLRLPHTLARPRAHPLARTLSRAPGILTSPTRRPSRSQMRRSTASTCMTLSSCASCKSYKRSVSLAARARARRRARARAGMTAMASAARQGAVASALASHVVARVETKWTR